MADAEVLSRIDAHMAETKLHMARGNELMARFTAMHEDLREFTREMLRRHELAMRDVSRELRELQAETRANTDRLLELGDETRAQRGAVLTLADELRERGFGGQA